MAWTTIPDTNLQPDKPARSIDALALRDNPIAIANGDSGAPNIASDAAINWSGGGVGTTSGRNWVVARLVSLSVGAVGTYAFLKSDAAVRAAGLTLSGASLSYASVTGNGGAASNIYSSGSPSGTWMLMGATGNNALDDAVSLWLRIS